MFYTHDISWCWWLVVSVGMLAFWAVVIYAIVLLVRGSSPGGDARPDENPEEILKRRLARGDISIDQYEELQAEIHALPHDGAAA
jgi:putative membrane protein